MKTTISLIKADIGSIPGHMVVHPDILELVEEEMERAVDENVVLDAHIFNAGDDTEILMTHTKGVDNPEIHKLAWDVFVKGADKARELGLYGAGQDLLADAFSGNVKGMGPGVAEMEIEERPAEPILAFAADKTEPGAFNLPVYRVFADPFNTAGLIIDPSMHAGFKFTVIDIKESKKIQLSLPEEMYDLLAFIGHPGRFVIKYVHSKDENRGIAAAVSTEKLALIAGKYVGKDDPVCLIRSQSGFPAVGEVLEGFSLGHLVSGWMRGSHRGPLMPVPLEYSQCTRFDGPPRVVGLGFQLKNGNLEGPIDLFDDPAFDLVRQRCSEITDFMRRHGPFEPGMLPLDEMEYTTLPAVLTKLQTRLEDIE
ncbi:MAG: fructose-1,6-bisphosphate aldolase/phosphatase [Candidatus Hodarchaeota archaeon]